MKALKIIIIATLVILGIGLSSFFIIFEEIDLKFYNTPIELEPVVTGKFWWDQKSISGIYHAEFGYHHDCYGCESKNSLWITIADDTSITGLSTYQEIDHLFRLEKIEKFYGIPKGEPIIRSSDFVLRGNCLIELTQLVQPFPPEHLDQLNKDIEYYNSELSKYGCWLNSFELPNQYFKIEFNEPNLILTPLNW